MDDLKARAVRGGFAKLCAQGASFVLRFAFLVVMARLLDPADFGLVAMVTVVTGVYEIFASVGLSQAVIQKATLTEEQTSTIFWVNMIVGVSLALLCVATAPILVSFYNEPRLFSMTVVTGSVMILNAIGAQHFALLQRQLRYISVAVIETAALLISVVVGIGMALAGFGYWSLVGSAIASALVGAVVSWSVTSWMPGRPRWASGIGSMLHFGGTITLNTLVVHIAYNFEKVLLGRYWGADTLGIYGRAGQLINIPTSQLNSAVGGVAFAALSRLQNDHARLRNYFLKGYSLVISMTVPITMFFALFAEDIILVVLGPKWTEAASVFRLLTPTVLIFGIINPLSWLAFSIGLHVRSLAIALVIAPLVITSYFIGLPYGPNGVALAYSTAMTLWLVPHVYWCLHGTMISPGDLFRTIMKPFVSGIVAAAVCYSAHYYIGQLQWPLLRLLLAGIVMGGVYLAMLLFVMGQKAFYLDLLKGLKSTPHST